MKKISKLVDRINEEVNDAKDYAELYLESKGNNDSLWTSRYAEMSEDELRHATYIHELAVAEIDRWKNIVDIPIDMQEKWNKAHKKYLEKVSIIKKLLAM